MDNFVKVRVHAPSGTIVLQRPEKRNAMSRLMMLQIQQALDDLHQERRVRAVILTGAGTAFCAGVDLAEIHATLDAEDALEQWQRDRHAIEATLRDDAGVPQADHRRRQRAGPGPGCRPGTRIRHRARAR